jgi:hypothetical protein
MKTLMGICPKCSQVHSKKELKGNPNEPLKVNEFFLKVNNVFFYYIDANEAYAKFTSEFCGAGNWMRYLFIPKNEIWVDISQPFTEVAIACWHEFLEAHLMLLGLLYDPAHLAAQKLEDFQRQNLAGEPKTDETFIDNLLSDNGIG